MAKLVPEADNALYLDAAVRQLNDLRRELRAAQWVIWSLAYVAGGEVFVPDSATLEATRPESMLIKITNHGRGYTIKAAKESRHG